MESILTKPGFDEQLAAMRKRAEGHYSFEMKIDNFKRWWIDAQARVRRFVQDYHIFSDHFKGRVDFSDYDFEFPEHVSEADLLVNVNQAMEVAWEVLKADLDKWEKIWAEKKGTHGHTPMPPV